MAQIYPEFELPNWVLTQSGSYVAGLAGSAAAPLSLNEIIKISSDPEITRQNLNLHDLPLGLGSPAGDEGLRGAIADLYATPASGRKVTADDVVVTNATTGANLLVFQSLLRRGSHVITQYPGYGQLVQWPGLEGAEVDQWRLDPDNDWSLDMHDLRSLIRPGQTQMLVLNNPHNPTGTLLSTARQAEIVQLCREHDIVLFCDEIFRPLFHRASVADTSSALEHASAAFDKIIATGSLSKPYGLSGTRVGWAVTPNPEIRRILVSMRQWTLSSVSVTDEVIAREALSPRCRTRLLDITLASARQNLARLERLVADFPDRIQCRVPDAAGTAFVKFLEADGSGDAVDDVQFCKDLRDREGLLLAPGSLTFGGRREGDFAGFVRVHITASTDDFEQGMEMLARFLRGRGREEKANGGL